MSDARRTTGTRTCLTRGAALTAAFLVLLIGVGGQSERISAADACSKEDFSREVDQAGEALRAFNSSMSPKLQSRIRQLKTAKGWSDADADNLAQDYLFDARVAGFDNKSNDLLTKLDELGQAGEGGGAECEKLYELKATGVELLAVMKAKSEYTLAKIDSELAAKQGGSANKQAAQGQVTHLPNARARDLVVAPDALVKSKPISQPGKKQQSSAAKKKLARRSSPQQAKPQPSASPDSWETVTQETLPPPGDTQEIAGLNTTGPTRDGQVLQLPPGALAGPDEGYTVEEIRDATKGFFGTISTNLATVLEHAFRQWGQPTAYVLGKEGGGAFLAGIRYGSGTLFMRSGKRRKVYWHGPSLGYDFGAEGSRTLYLIYSLRDPDSLYRSYTGVDGSAYLIGGVGVTLLKGGPVILAPIRSGIGLRLGANIGYVRFTPKPMWNPF